MNKRLHDDVSDPRHRLTGGKTSAELPFIAQQREGDIQAMEGEASSRRQLQYQRPALPMRTVPA